MTGVPLGLKLVAATILQAVLATAAMAQAITSPAYLAGMPNTEACNVMRGDIDPNMESKQNRDDILIMFNGTRKQGRQGKQCGIFQADRAKITNSRELKASGYNRERVFAFGRLCLLNWCDALSNGLEEPYARQSGQARVMAPTPPPSPEHSPAREFSVPSPGAQGFHVGCFADTRSANQFGTAGRSLSGFCLSSDAHSQPKGNCILSAPMTVAICVSECRARGFALAGAQYGNSCFCGAALGNTTPSNQCNMPCAGNAGETCGGEWANSVYRTDGGGDIRPDRGTGRAVIPNYPQPNGPCNQADAKTNIDWVFRDSAARGTMQQGQTRNLSPFDAVLYAQGHNRGAQQSLVNCRAWAEAYIGAQGVQGNALVLGNRRLGPADCACISIMPAGNGFGVTNACDPMIVRIFFQGQRHQSAPGVPHSFPDTQRANAGAIGINLPGFVLRPDWPIASISAYGLENAASEHVTCPIRR